MTRRQPKVVSMAAIAEKLRGPAETVPFVAPLHDLALEDPLAAITAIQKLRAVLDDAEALAVTIARSRRLTWAEITGPLGMPIQTAHRRFRHLDTRRNP